MITRLAVANYRSLLDLRIELGQLNLVTGANGSGKSNLYRALRLLAETAQGGVINALAREGGLSSTFWAGPETLTRDMKSGTCAIEGGPRQKPQRLKLGFADDDFGYALSLGLPTPGRTLFTLDPEIKRECIWAGPLYHPNAVLVDRNGPMVRVRQGRQWQVIEQYLSSFDSLLSHLTDASRAPEIMHLREHIKRWRFYDHLRTDQAAPSRIPQLGTRTTVLDNEGRDLAAALQTIREIGDHQGLDAAIIDAFPGSQLLIDVQNDNRFSVAIQQHGLLRPLQASELSDGTLRYLLWVAALLTPRPPPLMVLNEPENSLHPDLLPALARLIGKAAEHSQIWVISHASRLIAALKQNRACQHIALEKQLGASSVLGQDILDGPAWRWPDP